MGVTDGLPTPGEWEGTTPIMPQDLTEEDSAVIVRLHGQFAGLLSLANFKLSEEEAQLRRSETLAKHAHADAKLTAIRNRQSASASEIFANANDDFLKYDSLASEHRSNVIRLKGLRDIYATYVEALSRHWTMRMDEFNKYDKT